MEPTIIKNRPIIRVLLAIIGLSLGLFAIKYGQIDQGYHFLERYQPDFTLVGWFKLLATVAASGFLFLALAPKRNTTRGFFDESPTSMLPICVSVIVSVIMIWLAYVVYSAPLSLTPITDEGAIVENMTELFLASTMLVALFSLKKVRHLQAAKIGVIPAIVPLLLIAIVAFLIWMEEISWGQQKLDFATPAIFAGNIQNETNLHNFYTYRVDLVYYSTAFLVFILLPWVWPKEPNRYLKLVAFYIPPAGLLFISAPICALFYESWNTVPFQITLFLGLFILAHISMDMARGTQGQRLWCACLGLVILSTQIVYVLNGHGLSEGQELSEFKELLIAGAMLTYTAWLAWKVHGHKNKAS